VFLSTNSSVLILFSIGKVIYWDAGLSLSSPRCFHFLLLSESYQHTLLTNEKKITFAMVFCEEKLCNSLDCTLKWPEFLFFIDLSKTLGEPFITLKLD